MSFTRLVGRTEVIALNDAEGPFFDARTSVFPDAIGTQWAAADRFDPSAVTADGRWWLRFRCFALRAPSGEVTLVDAGIGPADAPAASWAPVPGRLPAELADAGIAVDDVTTVVLTHLHTDHVGWAVTGPEPDLRPYFPSARYLLQHTELAAVDELNPVLANRLIAPLRDTGQLHAVTGDHRLTPEIQVRSTPGHTPGHQSVLVSDGDDLLAVTGDLLVHAIQLLHPDLAYALETDPALARESRRRLLAEVAARDGRLATPHLGEPFIPVPTTG